MKTDDIVLELADREAIRTVLARYTRSVDRVDEALIRTVFWEDAYIDHGKHQASAGDFIAEGFKRLLANDQTSHFIGNMLIEVNGQAAAVETYFQSYHRRRNDPDGPKDDIVAGRYIDQMQKREGEWRILHREVIYDWYRPYADSADWTNAPHGHYETHRFPTDRTYSVFAALRTGA
jgi:hypothetical protein